MFCELLIAFVSIVGGIFIGVLLAGLTTSKVAEELFNDAYKLGFDKGMQAEKENVVEIIRKFAECNDDCKTNFYYNQGCNACFWNTIIKKIKGDPE